MPVPWRRCLRSSQRLRCPPMQALLSDGPLEGRKIGVDTNEHDLPPAKIEVDVEDGSVYAYGFADVDHDGGVAVYKFRDRWEH